MPGRSPRPPWSCCSPRRCSSARFCCSWWSRWSPRWCCRSSAARRWSGTRCVVFFQIVLLAGYGYAYGASRWLRPAAARRRCTRRCSLLPFAVLPFMIQAGSAPPPDGNPIGVAAAAARRHHRAAVLRAVDERIGASALVLADRIIRAARDPYFLYAASNLGSLLALVVVSGHRRAAADARRARPSLDRRLRRVRRAGRRLRGRWRGGRSGRSPANAERARHAADDEPRPARIATCRAARDGWRSRSFPRA